MIDYAAMVETYGMEQIASEIGEFIETMRAHDVQSLLEIGTGRQAGLARFCAEVLGWTVTTIDVSSPDVPLPNGVTFLQLNPGQVAYGLTEHFDLVFIDAAHNWESVDADYRCYGKLARFFVAFHDIYNEHVSCRDVPRYWYELAYVDGELKDDHHEIVSSEAPRAGIGWLEVQMML